MKRTCSVENCARRHFSRTYCSMHYARWLKHGDPTFSKMPERRALIEVGERFFFLTVTGPSDSRSNRRMWQCKCDCGSVVCVSGEALRSAKTKSCGCYKREILKTSNLRHGKSNTKTHSIWRGMLKRCTNPNCEAYKDYGGRGIKVCERWQGSDGFSNFLTDMGECPSSSHSIERTNTNGHYEPSNCIWLPISKQSLNTRRSRRFTINGETKTLRAWCDQFGVKYGFIYDRISVLGWDIERALKEPSHA